MTQKKLKIIGPYTPEHDGPFCTRDGRTARIVCTDRKVIGDDLPILCLVTSHAGSEVVYAYKEDGISHVDINLDLMNAREVPVAREFWIGLTANGANVYNSGNAAVSDCISHGHPVSGIIHVREVLPGEGA